MSVMHDCDGNERPGCMPSDEAVTIHSLERLAAERVTKQTLAQLDAMAAVQLLKEADKLKDVLWCVASHDLPTFLAAMPAPSEPQWVKKTADWWYLNEISSPVRLTWAVRRNEPRSLSVRGSQVYFGTIVVATTHEVHSKIAPKFHQHGIGQDAIYELVRASADYFTRKVDPTVEKWMEHSSVLGRRQEAAQLP